MSYSIELGAWNSVFAVPCSVVDRHLKLAGSVQLKVLLWILRHAGQPFEQQDIADSLGIDRADVGDSMTYWKETGLFTQSEPQDASNPKPEPARADGEPVPASPPVPEKQPEPPKRVLSRPQKADNAFVAERISESTDVSCLMQSAQQILGRLISNGESATLLMLHDDFGLPSDVIVMLLQYAQSIGRANMRYIEKTAMNWADEGILTHEKAEEKLQKLAESKEAWHTVEQAVGIPHRAPSEKEQAFASVWITQWNFGPPMIREAYDRSVDNTGKFSTSYMNKILERWHKNGITTTRQAEEDKLARAASRRSKRSETLSQDLDAFERSGVFDNFDRK